MKQIGRQNPSRGKAKKGPSGSQQALVGFVIKFVALMALYYVLVLLPYPEGLMYSYLAANAKVTGALLNAMGVHCQVSEVTISLAGFAINVRRGCDAIEPSWFFCAAVVSFPGAWSKKLPALVAGTLIILGANLVRLVSLFLIGLHYPRMFAVAHLELWPAAFIVLTMLLFVSWVHWTRLPARVRANAPA
jgi:exosortase H (IPTLxxWG-CTERM-specific)